MNRNEVGEFGGQRRSRRYNSGRFEADLQRGQVTRDLNFKQRISKRESGIMTVSQKEVVTIPPTTTVMGAAKTMVGYNYRRLPVADPGTKRIEGICTVMDFIDYLGGGEKRAIIERKYDGNMILAINAPVTEIMQYDVVTVSDESSLEDAISLMISRSVGGLPVIDEERRIVGILTERDVVRIMGDAVVGRKVSDIMSRQVTTAPPDMTIEEAARMMVSSDFRRLPVTAGNLVCGIITATDIMRYLGSGDAFRKLVTGNVHEAMGAPISSIMKTDILTIRSDEDLGGVAQIMARNRIGCMPVIDSSGLTGIVTEHDIVMSLKEAV
ncbi:CBS domain-containing protein [Methanocella arvoryzae]|uniref:Conserved hypothetical CBS domain protein n=1 Tax=Methanocella arvoryzae (strain DSM 22066 / NBRC 105507 / MRE50) TaxID=351160 RepID=Q0W3J9_METAR|nr:CBS domain-containing protein [Methanocella arvoryzae]CAJ37044.1 conserved hypothetical CBS domain protein [Methanocella arvoryzae MRE50]